MLEFAPTLSSGAALDRVLQTSADLRLNLTLLDRVMALRTQFAADGNRRRLFAAFDDLIVADLPSWTGPAPRLEPGRVKLRRLTLRNWKVFAAADLHFPDYEDARPVVLIGGKNGYGKTSLLQALIYGLFGPGASEALQRGGLAPQAARGSAYRAFIERALHRPAVEQGAGLASVRSEWDTPDGPIVVERRWYYDGEGRFAPEDETVTLWLGPDLDLIEPPPEVERAVFMQQQIEHRLLPLSLAPFVFFDGEQIKRLSERRFADQVLAGAEAVLGLAAWRDAATDLKAYARDRARGVSREDAELEGIASELLLMEAEDAELEARLGQIDQRRRAPRDARDERLSRLAALQSNTYADLHQLLEQQQALGQDLGRARHEFAAAISAAAPLAFVPATLKSRLADRLRVEMDLTQPWRDLFANTQARAVFLAALEAEIKHTHLPEPIVASAARAWDGLSAVPASVAPTRHDYLGAARQRLVQGPLASGPPTGLVAAAQRLGQLQAELLQVTTALAELRRRDDETAHVRAQLGDITATLAELDGETGEIQRRRDTVGAKLEQLRQQALASSRAAEDPAAERPQRALHAAVAIERLLEALRPLSFDALGRGVSEAYRALAHKRLIDQVRIDPDGEVKLFGNSGQELHAVEASAGEHQVFAMALVAAVGELAPHRLPVVIDTPLGRLDPEHRERILAYFTARPFQTIMLSQPDEVNGRYLTQIEARVAARFRLDHIAAESGGPGGSVPTPGAYPELAA